MQNIRLTLQYDGTRYLGWQRPAKHGYEKTISFRLAEILKKTTGEDILLHAGAKTEPGVHAAAQTVSFETHSGMAPEEILSVFNQYLPRDISVLSARQAPPRFRADLNALSRTYEYSICCSKIYDVFRMKYETHLYPGPDIRAMKSAAGFLLGRHDFRPFSDAGKKASTEKEILSISFDVSDGHISILVTAGDFLSRMPQFIICTLLSAGFHTLMPEDIPRIFAGEDSSGNILSGSRAGRKKAGGLFVSKALLLRSIQYD